MVEPVHVLHHRVLVVAVGIPVVVVVAAVDTIVDNSFRTLVELVVPDILAADVVAEMPRVEEAGASFRRLDPSFDYLEVEEEGALLFVENQVFPYT